MRPAHLLLFACPRLVGVKGERGPGTVWPASAWAVLGPGRSALLLAVRGPQLWQEACQGSVGLDASNGAPLPACSGRIVGSRQPESHSHSHQRCANAADPGSCMVTASFGQHWQHCSSAHSNAGFSAHGWPIFRLGLRRAPACSIASSCAASRGAGVPSGYAGHTSSADATSTTPTPSLSSIARGAVPTKVWTHWSDSHICAPASSAPRFLAAARSRSAPRRPRPTRLCSAPRPRLPAARR